MFLVKKVRKLKPTPTKFIRTTPVANNTQAFIDYNITDANGQQALAQTHQGTTVIPMIVSSDGNDSYVQASIDLQQYQSSQ